MTLESPAPLPAASAPRPRRICVFCGAHMGARPEYAQAARETGRLIAESGVGVVYGGTSIGLMGLLADAALAGGGEVIGVLPAALQDKEIAHRGLSALHVVESLAERKQLMFDLADAFVTLPGGTGTLDELSEMLTWAQLGFSAKPLGLLNVSGYFDALLAFLRHAMAEGMIAERHLARLAVATEPARLLEALLPRKSAASGG
jgi:uncharacterized protein (TIGR00730 family)